MVKLQLCYCQNSICEAEIGKQMKRNRNTSEKSLIFDLNVLSSIAHTQ